MANRRPLERSHWLQGPKKWRPDLQAGQGQGTTGKVPASVAVSCSSSPHPPQEWQHPPGQVDTPEKHQQLQRQVGQEERVVAFAHTVLHPGAVVVIAAHAAATLAAVAGP